MKPENKLRVALMVSELLPGGMERVVVYLAKGFSSRGIETMVICLQEPGELAPELEGTGVRLEALYSLTGKDVMAAWRLRTLLRRFRPTLINLHDYTSAPYAVAANWLAGRVPIIFTAHGELYEGFDHLQTRLRFFSKSFSLLTAVSKEIAECHKKFLGWSVPTTVIRNGVPTIEHDDKLRIAARTELGCSPNDILFLSIGNPRSEKAFEDLIDATAILRDFEEGDLYNFKVVVAGKLIESDYCQMLSRRLTERGVQDQFRFLGYRNDTQALYSAADVFVLSSRSEGLPMVILESMMIGLPVIATRVGGVPDAVKDKGILVDAASPKQLALAMKKFLLEKELGNRLGQAGKAYVRAKYGVDSMVENYINCYKNILFG